MIKKEDYMDQCQLVYDYIIRHGGITKKEAARIDVLNLPGRVFDLKQKGHDVVRQDIWYKTKSGRMKRYGRYTLKEFLSEEE